MEKVDKTNQVDEKKVAKKKRKWKFFWYFFGWAAGITITALAIYWGIVTCGTKQPEVETQIYQVETIDGKVTLVGFDENVSQEEIVKELKDTLTIPKETQVIADNAFNRDGQSTIPSEINKINWNGAPIERIGNNAFKGWTSLQSLTIPSGVEVGDNAFADCAGLNEIHLEGFGSNLPKWGKNIFAGENKNQGTIYIQSNLDYQKWYDYLTQQQGFTIDENHWVIIPIEKTIFDVRENVLYGFAPLITDEDIAKAFKDHILVLPDGITRVADNAFYDGTKSTIPEGIITNIRFNSQLQTIGANAFKLAPFESELSIPNNVTSIAQGAFYSTGITSLVLPNEEISITGAEGNGAFENCTNLVSIDLTKWSEVPTDMGTDTFAGQADSGTIYIQDSSLATSWKTFFISNYDFTFDADHWKVDPDVQDTVLEIEDGVLLGFYDWATEEQIIAEFGNNMVIPDTVTSVADDAFWEIEGTEWHGTIPSGIEKITFEGLNVTSIGDRAFAFNGYIQDINLDNNWKALTSIGDDAFLNCNSLSMFNGSDILSLPDKMNEIGQGAFIGCTSIKGVQLPVIENNATVGTSAFAFGGQLQTLDFSNLTISDGDPYDPSCTMSIWMDLGISSQPLFNGLKANEGSDCNIYLPGYGGTTYADAKEAFLLSNSTQPPVEGSAFYWLYNNFSSNEDRVRLQGWNLISKPNTYK